ncbi:DUF2225 domain-containing protein [Serpentinicella sp. ANB-PHB4]|uniref:DUF2225 domain-containing protein n=1 Tax=Serpentinicella sp. ANB-PHB4 TaxID=3074076 RepID=UPI002865834E|nr:DUF2225 domain-containing protein [Serpentinicella sp. ANB-PHB4]MDR5658992.1 DUF2225 domain-containing protein [Serpentinicella sp. ANB-PHB4]
MEKFLYDKEVECPICKNNFSTKKVRTRALRVQKRDEDFCVTYKDINPIYYHMWICPECGYSASESEFNNVSKEQKEVFDDRVRKRWKKRAFGSDRSFEEAEESYKLAILTGQILKKSQGYIASLCLKLAWLYREQNHEKERDFLKYALSYFEDAYQNERFPIGGLDEVSLAYLVGELNRRVGDPKESISWYAKALDHPDIKKHRQIQLKAREQWRLAREQHQKKVD